MESQPPTPIDTHSGVYVIDAVDRAPRPPDPDCAKWCGKPHCPCLPDFHGPEVGR